MTGGVATPADTAAGAVSAGSLGQRVGSQRWHVAQAVLGATRAAGHALTLAACYEAYQQYAAQYAAADDGRTVNGGSPPPLTKLQLHDVLNSMRRCGLLGSAGRYRHLQVWHRDHCVPPRPDADPASAILAAVDMAYVRWRRPVCTREVTAELPAAMSALGHSPAALASVRYNLTTMLETLAGGQDDPRTRSRRRRTHLLVRLGSTNAVGRRSWRWLPMSAAEAEGVPRARWSDGRPLHKGVADAAGAATAPGGQPSPAPSGPPVGGPPAGGPPAHVAEARARTDGGPHLIIAPLPGSIDALRRGIAAAGDALGRPVSLQEVGWWAEGNASRDAVARAAAAARRRPDQVRSALRADLARPGLPGRVSPFTTGHTCVGGAPPRYIVGPAVLDDRGACRCRLIDAVAALRAGEEWSELGDVARRAAAAGFVADIEVLFAADRRVILAHGIRTAVADRPDALRAAVTAEREALRSLIAWGQAVNGTSKKTTATREYRLRLLAQRSADLEAAALVFDWWEQAAARDASAPGAPPLRGNAYDVRTAYVPRSDVAPLATAAAAALQVVGRDALTALLAPARRHPSRAAALRPVPDRPSESRTRHPTFDQVPNPIALYDRVDAVLCCFDALGPPRATALLARARRVLGHTFRDADRVAAVAAAAPRPADQRALMLALGLLGAADRVEELMRGWDRADPAAAAAAALALVVADPEHAAGRLAVLDTAARGAAQSVTDRALIRVQRGLLLSVLD